MSLIHDSVIEKCFALLGSQGIDKRVVFRNDIIYELMKTDYKRQFVRIYDNKDCNLKMINVYIK